MKAKLTYDFIPKTKTVLEWMYMIKHRDYPVVDAIILKQECN